MLVIGRAPSDRYEAQRLIRKRPIGTGFDILRETKRQYRRPRSYADLRDKSLLILECSTGLLTCTQSSICFSHSNRLSSQLGAYSTEVNPNHRKRRERGSERSKEAPPIFLLLKPWKRRMQLKLNLGFCTCLCTNFTFVHVTSPPTSFPSYALFILMTMVEIVRRQRNLLT